MRAGTCARQVSKMFRETFCNVEATIAKTAESKNLMKSRPLIDFGNLADCGHLLLLGEMEGGEDPSEKA